ncbi:hypothetical protein V7266_10855 [Neobacillus drentensis]|uniref:hypothetical protein n=1 Tax=Neobacillus drentensis TaxID=220684 RepID=UPI002FFFCEC3
MKTEGSTILNLQLIQQSFSTLILNAVENFPQEIEKIHFETYGLLFGLPQETRVEIDYTYPISNVKSKTDRSISPNKKVDLAIKNAQELISTSRCVGTYHSHPYEDYFEDWADPSDADVSYFNSLKIPYTLIIAITRNSMMEKPFHLEYRYSKAHDFYIEGSKIKGVFAKAKPLDAESRSIYGEFKKYQFEIRAYQCTGETLRDMNLYSSEAEMLMSLREKNINLKDLTPEQSFRLRKIEYNFRNGFNKSQREERKLENSNYHLDKLFKQSAQEENKGNN